jgi:hypothetical protein
MAKSKDGSWTNMQTQTLSNGPNEADMPRGWKYKSLKVGPFKLPCYASPESQLILVSFVCFLCPGKALPQSSSMRVTDRVQGCSMLSTASEQQALMTTPKPATPLTPLSTLRSLSWVSSPAPSPMFLASVLLFRLAALGTASTSAHISASTSLRTSDMWFSLASYWDAVLASCGPHKARS